MPESRAGEARVRVQVDPISSPVPPFCAGRSRSRDRCACPSPGVRVARRRLGLVERASAPVARPPVEGGESCANAPRAKRRIKPVGIAVPSVSSLWFFPRSWPASAAGRRPPRCTARARSLFGLTCSASVAMIARHWRRDDDPSDPRRAAQCDATAHRGGRSGRDRLLQEGLRCRRDPAGARSEREEDLARHDSNRQFVDLHQRCTSRTWARCPSSPAYGSTPTPSTRPFKRAVEAGAQVKMPLADMFWGDRMGSLLDRWGNRWTLAQHTKVMSPEEMRLASEEAAAQVEEAGKSEGGARRPR